MFACQLVKNIAGGGAIWELPALSGAPDDLSNDGEEPDVDVHLCV